MKFEVQLCNLLILDIFWNHSEHFDCIYGYFQADLMFLVQRLPSLPWTAGFRWTAQWHGEKIGESNGWSNHCGLHPWPPGTWPGTTCTAPIVRTQEPFTMKNWRPVATKPKSTVEGMIRSNDEFVSGLLLVFPCFAGHALTRWISDVPGCPRIGRPEDHGTMVLSLRQICVLAGIHVGCGCGYVGLWGICGSMSPEELPRRLWDGGQNNSWGMTFVVNIQAGTGFGKLGTLW